jgi:CBS domain-containing protein
MQLNDIMTQYEEVIAPESSLEEAAKQMRSLDVGVLPVSTPFATQTVWWVGMLTDRDITIRAVAEGKDPRIRVEEVMTSNAYCFEDQDAAEAEQVMEKNQIRRLPVLDREKFLVGIVSWRSRNQRR